MFVKFWNSVTSDLNYHIDKKMVTAALWISNTSVLHEKCITFKISTLKYGNSYFYSIIEIMLPANKELVRGTSIFRHLLWSPLKKLQVIPFDVQEMCLLHCHKIPLFTKFVLGHGKGYARRGNYP